MAYNSLMVGMLLYELRIVSLMIDCIDPCVSSLTCLLHTWYSIAGYRTYLPLLVVVPVVSFIAEVIKCYLSVRAAARKEASKYPLNHSSHSAD